MKSKSYFIVCILLGFIFLFLYPAEASRIFYGIHDGGIGTDYIRSINLNGTDPQNIVTISGNYQIRGLAVDSLNHKVYWLQYNAADGYSYLKKADSDVLDSNITTLDTIATPSDAYGVDLDIFNNHVYYGVGSDTSIKRVNTDGLNPTTLLNTAGGGIKDLALDLTSSTKKMYWTSYNSIKRANLDGSSPEDLSSEGAPPYGIDVGVPTNNLLYWTDSYSVSSRNNDGTGSLTVVTSTAAPLKLDVDAPANYIYYSKSGFSSEIRRVELNGNNPTSLKTETGYYIGSIALLMDNTRTINNNMDINLGDDVIINFASITSDGETFKLANPAAESIFLANSLVGDIFADTIFEITTSASINYGSGFDVKLSYPADSLNGIPETEFQIFHYTGIPGNTVEQGIIVSRDTVNNLITAHFTSGLSPFGVGVNPEPTTLLLLGSALLGLLGLRRRK